MHCDPKIVGELNGQHVTLVKLWGEFVRHNIGLHRECIEG
jgi:hypothetical protein